MRYGLVALFLLLNAPSLWAFSSTNINLDNPVYPILEKLAGFGLIKTDVKGLKPFSKAEAARLILEAEQQVREYGDENAPTFTNDLIQEARRLVARETELRESPPAQFQTVDIDPLAGVRTRFVQLDGSARDYNRSSKDPGHQSAFGFIGGDLRPFNGGIVTTTGSEGTPLLENNNGINYRHGSNAELRWSAEGHLFSFASALVEPMAQFNRDDTQVRLNRGYLKLGGGGLELEVGRDENWFGPGYRGTTVLTNNASNFDQIKISSPEPLDVEWVKNSLGSVKYSFLFSRFDETGAGKSKRQPYLLGMKLAIKPSGWFETGINVVRQFGGPGFNGSPNVIESIFGGGNNDHSNTIAGLDVRFRIPWLGNTELYGEFSGEDNAGGVWPIVESYVAGVYIPSLTSSGRDDFRFEYFSGSVMLYGDWQFPAGYVYHGMTPGHSQGTNSQEFYGRYSHWFSARNNLGLEYYYTERGRTNRVPGQVMESKHAGRVTWMLPLISDIDAHMTYGSESINNTNLVSGATRSNNLGLLEIRYRY